MDKDTEIEDLKVLQELREGQKQQLEKQGEALELQRANFALVKEQFDRANKLHDRAEQIQESGAQLMATARKSAIIVIPIIVIFLFFVGWLIYRLF